MSDQHQLERYFSAASDAFDKAQRSAGGVVEHRYEIGGHDVALRFAGQALRRPMTDAFAHLPAGGAGAPSLTVCLWDSASTGTPLPPTPWREEDLLIRGEAGSCGDGPVFAAAAPWAETLWLLHPASARAIFWTSDARSLHAQECAAPLRPILHWWLSRYGIHLVHGAVVGGPEGGLLLAGKGGSGKSTTALACLEAGWQYLGDDYVAVRTAGEPLAFSLYSSAKASPEQLRRWPALAKAAANPAPRGTEKTVLFLAGHAEGRIVSSLPLRAVVLPRVADRDRTHWSRASAAAGLTALAPSTILQLPGAAQASLRALGELARRLPIVRLELGRCPDEAAAAMSGLLAQA